MKYLKLSLLILIITTLSIIVAQEADTPSSPLNSVVTVPEALIRSGPDTDYVPVGSLAENSILTPINISEDGLWVLVQYRGGFGWIRQDLAFWAIAIDELPIIYSDALTPTIAPTEPSTPMPFATATPVGDYVLTGSVNVLVRSGPGRNYSRIGRLQPGSVVAPVSIDETGDWVLIRYTDRIATAVGFGITLAPTFDGHAWVSRMLVAWTTDLSTLPVMGIDNLTPSPTPNLPRTATSTPSNTPTSTQTTTPTLTPSATLTSTSMPTETATNTATETPIPTETATNTATETPAPTETATNTATETPVPTETATNTATETPVPTETVTNTATKTPVPTETATNTATETPTEEIAIALAVTDDPATEESPTSEPTPAPIEPQPEPTLTDVTAPAENPAGRLPLELIIGGVVVLLVLLYIALYIRGQATVDRYINGFPLKDCPVCGDGVLTVDTRIERSLGIPNGKHIIRCSKCRSTLRETDAHQWRYAVDRSANPQLYMTYNNRTLSEREVVNIPSTPLPSRDKPITRPEFSDEDTSHDAD